MRLVDLLRFAALVAVRRSRADWRMQAAVAFGILLAVTLMAAGTIYSNALAETSLRYTLANARPQDLNLTLTAYQALERSAFGSLQRVEEERVRQPQATYMGFHSLLVRSSTMYFSQQSILDLPEEERLRGDLQAVPLLSREVRVVEGRLPGATYREMEVALDPLGASILGLSLGQSFYAFPAAKGDVTLPVPLRVVGIVELVVPGTDYWQLGNRYHFSVGGQTRWEAAPLYIDLDSLVDGVGKAIPGLPADFIWHYELKREEFSAPQVNAAKAAVRGVERDLKIHIPSSRWDTKLDTVLERHSVLLTLARVPLLLVIFLVMGILLYYLFLVAGLMGRLRTPEVAVFRSRGASSWQVGQVLFMEGLLIALPATVVGPFVARGLVWFTGRLFPAGDQALALVSLSPLDFLVGGIGGMMAVAVLTVTTVVAARQGVVAFGKASARPPTVPWFHKYYIDLALLGLIALLWWQLRSRGSFLVQPRGGEGLELEATMLLGPVVTLLAGGPILLRLFPLLVRLLSRFVEPLGPPWLVHGLRRTARDPVPWGSLMVLMALTTALGALASAFSATLEKSQEDQARYEAGADVRIQYSQNTRDSTPLGLASSLQSLPGVAKATDVMRADVSAASAAFGRSATMLAVEPGELAQVAWSRRDFTGVSLDKALSVVESPKGGTADGIPVPAGATSLGVWANAGNVPPGASLRARLKDASGRYFDVSLGSLAGKEWQYLEAPITPVSISRFSRRQDVALTVVPPYILHALWVAPGRGRGAPAALFLDQLQAITPQGLVEMESFQDIQRWQPIADPASVGLYALTSSQAVARPGRRSAAFTWGAGGLAVRGIYYGSPLEPLPALVSPSFLEANLVKVGDQVSIYAGTQLVPLKIGGVADFFPTLDPRESPFVVVGMAALVDYVSLRSRSPIFSGMESWLQIEGSGLNIQDVEQVIEEQDAKVTGLFQAQQMVAQRARDPLLAAGWSGLLTISFMVVVVASASGLLLHTYIDSRQRLAEFAILRSIGFPPGNVYGVIGASLAVTVALGVAFGSWGGQWLGRAIIPLLEVAENGSRVTPPMALENYWGALGIAYVVLAAVSMVAVGALLWVMGRMELHRFLRMGDV